MRRLTARHRRRRFESPDSQPPWGPRPRDRPAGRMVCVGRPRGTSIMSGIGHQTWCGRHRPSYQARIFDYICRDRTRISGWYVPPVLRDIRRIRTQRVPMEGQGSACHDMDPDAPVDRGWRLWLAMRVTCLHIRGRLDPRAAEPKLRHPGGTEVLFTSRSSIRIIVTVQHSLGLARSEGALLA